MTEDRENELLQRIEQLKADCKRLQEDQPHGLKLKVAALERKLLAAKRRRK